MVSKAFSYKKAGIRKTVPGINEIENLNAEAIYFISLNYHDACRIKLFSKRVRRNDVQ